MNTALTPREQHCLIAAMVERMRESDGWAGETHIQKGLYFWKTLCGVPFSYSFILYKHGPYSFDLHNDMGRMIADRILKLEPRYPYGPSFLPGQLATILTKRCEETLKRHRGSMAFIVKSIGNLDVRTLERYATALYVIKGHLGINDTELGRMITKLKPHISSEQASEALRAVRTLVDEANAEGVLAASSG